MTDLFGAAPAATPAPEPTDKPALKAAPKPAKKATPKPPTSGAEAGYDASAIEVLEGLEPVRRRPGMYIGGTDERALHHLFAEVIDNSMDEAVAGHASRIEVELMADGSLSVSDNGRGIPVDPHPKMPEKSALEVIMTTLHAGGKFDSKVYETSGGLHGVGVSVVNALSNHLEVEVARDRKIYRQIFARGVPQGPLEVIGETMNRRGTTVRFHPDAEIFGKSARFKPARLMKMARSKAYLFAGVEIRWTCARNCWRASKTFRKRPSFPSLVACRIIWLSRSAMSGASQSRCLLGARRTPASMAVWSGRFAGMLAMPRSPPIATRCQRRRVALTKLGCAWHCSKGCGPMPS